MGETVSTRASPPASTLEPVPDGPEATEPTETTESKPRTYVVAPFGSDDQLGTVDEPWRSIGFALRQLEAGDTLLMRGGEYAEAVILDALNPGTPTAPILVAAYPNEEPVIRGLVALTDPDFWVFDSLIVEWNPDIGDPEDHMFKITGGQGWQLINSELRNARSFAALLIAEGRDGAPTNWKVSDNCIHDTIPTNDRNQDHLIYVNTGSEPTNGIIERNVMWGASNGSGIKLGGASPDSGGAAGVTARFNTIVSTAQSFVVSWTAYDNVIESNLMAVVPEGRSHIRGFELTGEGNLARFNLADVRPLVWSDPGFQTVESGPGNQVGVDPQFTRPQDCNGWVAAGAVGTTYGHLANQR